LYRVFESVRILSDTFKNILKKCLEIEQIIRYYSIFVRTSSDVVGCWQYYRGRKMAGKKYNSCLKPFLEKILKARETIPPTSYAKISEILEKEDSITVRGSTIHSFLKTLAKGYKPCELTKAIRQAEARRLSTSAKPRVLGTQKQTEALDVQKPMVTEKPQPENNPSREFNMKWSNEYNLNRLSEEEAADMRRIIEERRKK
jgi:hypothetical protein